MASSDEPNTGYCVFYNNYGWDVDFTNLFPIKTIHEFSIVGYRRSNTGDFTYSQVAFTGPWTAQILNAILPISGNNIFGLSGGYNAAVNLLYTSPSTTYIGAQQLSPYAAMRHPSGEIYGAGYTNLLFRYNPLYGWTLTNTNSMPKSGAPDPNWAVNPYFISMGSTPQLHYRSCLDYDANGLVWVGGNTTRLSNDYGDVMWYNPVDGSTGYMFPSWAASKTLFRNLCAAKNRSLICVSDNNDNIWIINASAKKVDPVPINPIRNKGSKTYMIEVENDIVFGIVLSASGNKVIRFRPSNKQVLTLQDLGVSGTPFGFADNYYSRMNYKLELGPDGYVWIFVGNSLYRVHPKTCVFTKVMDTTHAKLKFASNNRDLLLYDIDGTTSFKYIPGILEELILPDKSNHKD